MRLSEILVQYRDEIVRRFVDQVQAQDVAPDVKGRGLLVDHIPKFLDEVAREVGATDRVRPGQDANDHSPSAMQHGQQRFAIGYQLDAVVREYGILRQCILRLAKEHAEAISVDEFDVLAKCLNIGVAEGVRAFSAARDAEVEAQKANLEFLAEAGRQLTSTLEHRLILLRLTELLVPRLASWCAVYLNGMTSVAEMPMAHVDPTRIDLLRTWFEAVPLPRAEPFGYARVLQSASSELVLDSQDPRNHLPKGVDPRRAELFEKLRAERWMVIPLISHGQTIGAMVLGDLRGADDHASSDLLIAEELAGRAAAALENARLYELAQQQRSKVEAAIRAKDEFVAVISHELRTPLNSILGWTRMLRGTGLTPPKRAHALEVIERNANAQNQLIADLLDISRIITGKVRINPSQLDFSNLVEMTLESLRPAAEGKHLQVEVDLERDNALVRADGDRLQQILWNLLTNAVKFTPKHGHIAVTLKRVDSSFEFVVKDDGAGISAEFLPHVFEHFRQADGGTVRNHGGLGLGLSIAKHLVELHGGTLSATSDGVGLGAEFKLTIPVSLAVSDALGIQRLPAVAPASEPTRVPEGLAGLRVLIVDDGQDSRDLLATILGDCDMLVATAQDAAQALELLGEFRPDLLISDIGMPGTDGYALIRSVRSQNPGPGGQRPDLPAIALTAYARNEDRTRALSEGFNEHLTKPVEPDQLLQAIAGLVGRIPGAPAPKPLSDA